MQTQKADLTQMAVKKDDTVLVEKNISAAAGDTGLAQTVQVPKKSNGADVFMVDQEKENKNQMKVDMKVDDNDLIKISKNMEQIMKD